MADKVGDKPADRHLAAKRVAFGLPRPQYLPEALFGFGHLPAEGAGARARTRIRRFLHHGSVLGITPTPTLPHRGGGNVGAASRSARHSTSRRCRSAISCVGSAGSFVVVVFRPPPRWGRVWVGVTRCRASAMAACTPSRLPSTSLFQNRNTRYPSASRNLVRVASASDEGSCCPPSISTISLAGWQTKSAMNPPIGTCRRNR